jgi:hypothetical protein
MHSSYLEHEAIPAPVVPDGLIQLGVMLAHNEANISADHGASVIPAGE